MARTRGNGNLRFAVLGLVSARANGMHGYQLKAEFDVLCDEFWELNYGMVYRVLDDLEREGKLTGAMHVQEGRRIAGSTASPKTDDKHSMIGCSSRSPTVLARSAMKSH